MKLPKFHKLVNEGLGETPKKMFGQTAFQNEQIQISVTLIYAKLANPNLRKLAILATFFLPNASLTTTLGVRCGMQYDNPIGKVSRGRGRATHLAAGRGEVRQLYLVAGMHRNLFHLPLHSVLLVRT